MLKGYYSVLEDIILFGMRLALFPCCLPNLSDVTRILSSLEELKRSSFSRKYSSMHCSSKSCKFFSSSSVMKSSVGFEINKHSESFK